MRRIRVPIRRSKASEWNSAALSTLSFAGLPATGHATPVTPRAPSSPPSPQQCGQGTIRRSWRRGRQPWPANGAALDRIHQDHVERMVGHQRLAAARPGAGIRLPEPGNSMLVDAAQPEPDGRFCRRSHSRFLASGANGLDDLRWCEGRTLWRVRYSVSITSEI